MIAATRAISSAASEIAKRAKKRLSTELPAAADKNPEQNAGDKYDHRRAQRAVFHFFDHGLRRALGLAPAAFGCGPELVRRVRAPVASRVLQDFRDLHEIPTQVFQFGT